MPRRRRPGPAGSQAALALDAVDDRDLLGEHFRTTVLPAWPEYAGSDVRALHADLLTLWTAEADGLRTANEAQTEERFVKPILDRLGFAYTDQAAVTTAAGHRQPDYALFASDEDRRAASTRSGAARFEAAVAVCDAKRFDRDLDRRSRETQRALSEEPVAQIIH